MPPCAQFAELARTPTKPAFSSYLMNSVGLYIVLSGACTFWPRVKAVMKGEADEETLVEQLKHAPVSTFTWHHADIRVPLPSIDELTEHPIGVRDGHRVFLCAERHLISAPPKYVAVEFSEDFTDYYGERVYVCSA